MYLTLQPNLTPLVLKNCFFMLIFMSKSWNYVWCIHRLTASGDAIDKRRPEVNLRPAKSDTMFPTTWHSYVISSKKAVLPASAMTQRWVRQFITCFGLIQRVQRRFNFLHNLFVGVKKYFLLCASFSGRFAGCNCNSTGAYAYQSNPSFKMLVILANKLVVIFLFSFQRNKRTRTKIDWAEILLCWLQPCIKNKWNSNLCYK